MKEILKVWRPEWIKMFIEEARTGRDISEDGSVAELAANIISMQRICPS